MPRWWCFLPLLWAVEGDHDEIGPGDMVVTHHENAGLQDGRHDRFPCTKQPEVIPWNRAHVFKINHEPYTNEKKVFVRKGEVPPLTQVSVADFKDGGYFEAHDHEDMFEIFYVLNGSGKFAITERGIDGESWSRVEIKAEAGLFLHVPPGVQHAGLSDAGLQFLMVGGATDAKCTKTAIMEAKEAMECKAATRFQQLQVAEVESVQLSTEKPHIQRRMLQNTSGMPNVRTLEHITMPYGESYEAADDDAGLTKVFVALDGWAGIRLPPKTGLLEKTAVAVVPPHSEFTITAASPMFAMLRFAVEPCSAGTRDEL